MARFDISILGDKGLSQALATLPDRLERRVVTRALRNTTRFLRQVTQSNTPQASGRLRRSYTIRALRRRRGRVGYRLSPGSRAELGIAPGTRSYYPAHVELGTEHNAAIAFMRRSLREQQATLFANLRLEIGQGIDREARKL